MLVLIILSILMLPAVTDAVDYENWELIGMGQLTMAYTRFRQDLDHATTRFFLAGHRNTNLDPLVNVQKSITRYGVCMTDQKSMLRELHLNINHQGYSLRDLTADIESGCKVTADHSVPQGVAYTPGQKELVAMADYIVAVGRKYNGLSEDTKSNQFDVTMMLLINWKHEVTNTLCNDVKLQQRPAYINTLYQLNNDRENVVDDLKYGCQWMEANDMKNKL